ncbi:iron-siderophore ABC transporter substrate-binding protein [Shinella sp.]|uniref:iron-siderophore ABC transporter substrate-binding protein n=1 Tax=Shinella sp. TaxID=1870904 RepID=UPI003F707BAB
MRVFAFLILCLLPVSWAAACDGRMISEDIFGPPVCVPANPQRIAVLDPLMALGILFELKVPVIAAPLHAIQDDAIRAEAERQSLVDLGDAKQPSLERLVALKPDLIIGTSIVQTGSYDTASKIAPTLLIDHVDWKRQVRLLADIVGRSEAAEADLAAYEARLADIRKRVPDKRVSMVRLSPFGFNVYLDGPAAYAPYAVLHEAGVRRTDYETTTDDTVVKRPDWEELGQLSGDILLYVAVGGYDTAPDDALVADVTANPFWQMLPAVQAGRAHRVGRAAWNGFHGVASAHQVLDDIERYILTTP